MAVDLDDFLAKQRREAEERDAKRRAGKLGMSYLDLVSVGVPTEIDAMKIVDEQKARAALLTPIQVVGKKLVVAVYDPNKKETTELISELKKKYDLTVAITSLSGLKHSWSYYQYVKKPGKVITGAVTIGENEDLKTKIQSIEDLAAAIENFKNPQTSKLLEIILRGAMALGASDIHLEPSSSFNTLRLRIDGLLHIATQKITAKQHHSLITRIKLLSGLKLNITDEPQDGRFSIKLKDREVEIRTSLIPSEYGETAVLRILDPKSLKVNLEELGWRKDDLQIVEAEIKKPNGLILNTGPTGSGKTTTLYAFLRRITSTEIKIITVEDPIEYHLPGISQTQVDPAAGYTFASGLRSILRQDPDVILVGEIRDKETAEIALNASLTGHLVFSTLHTNDAVGAVPRLIDLGVKVNILGPALSLVIAQRLVRKLCEKCKVPIEISEETKSEIKKFIDNLPPRVDKSDYQTFQLYKPKGCKDCNNLGYKGRTSIFELFLITEEVENLIYKNPTELEIKEVARQQGMVLVQEDGILKALKGITSITEVERLTGSIKWLKVDREEPQK